MNNPLVVSIAIIFFSGFSEENIIVENVAIFSVQSLLQIKKYKLFLNFFINK